MDKNKYRHRLIDPKVDFYLSTFGAVCIEGPKWCGKTWTSMMHAKSAFMLADPADNFANRELARMDVSKALVGESPHLIDDIEEADSVSLSVNTVGGYLDAFKRIYLTNDIGPFSTFLRSPARI